MSFANQAGNDYQLRDNPINRAIAALESQHLDASELRSHIDCARDVINGPHATTIRSLLEGMSAELDACSRLLQGRIASLSGGFSEPRWPQRDPQPFWRLFRTDGTDCPGHLEALLSGYVHFARATSDSITFLRLLGDHESVDLLEQAFEVAERGIWFIELYMEGLAVHMDTVRFPRFTPCIHAATADGSIDGE